MRLIDADYIKNLPFERLIHTDYGDTAIPIEEIDNAPTVCAENVDKVILEHETIALSKGLQMGYEQARKDFERPQGECDNCVTCDHFGNCEGCEKGEEE